MPNMREKLRAWWFERQGLAGMSGTAAETLAHCGWARSVGGANPYLTLFARSGTSREEADLAVENVEIHELPSARGCTYVLPSEDFALGLKVGQGTSEVAAINTARRYLGFTDQQLQNLCDGILRALEKEPLDPKKLKDALGDLVVNFGEEGKKRGQTTSLALGLGWLQAHGYIRRLPIGGRLDTQSYAYALWNPNPLDGYALSQEDAYVELARKYFRWIGPAKPAHFQWFAGLGVGTTKKALEPLGLQTLEDGYLILPEDRDCFEAFQTPSEPIYALVSCLDGFALHHRDVFQLYDEVDRQRTVPGEKGTRTLSAQDLTSNAILDRGRVVGLWEFDPEAGEIVKLLFVPTNAELERAVSRTEAFVRDQLGDARSFSLDSPKSRRPLLEAFRQM